MTHIVLVHGLFGHLEFPELRAAFGKVQVSAPDLIGYGSLKDADVSTLDLEKQAAWVIRHIEDNAVGPVQLVGHSVGGAVSALVAMRRPDLLAGLVSVEGNFTLKDAFWSGQIAKKATAEVEEIVAGYRADPDGWMGGAIDQMTPLASRLAREWLDNQPAATIQAQAKAVVATTGPDSYLNGLRAVMESDLPVHLIAGARSAGGWDVPDWANDLCRSRINLPGTGHLMMVESPERFAGAVLAAIRLQAD